VVALALLLAAGAAALVAVGTLPPGPGLYGDDAGYLGAAQSLARTGALRVPFATYTSADSTAPLAQWPPGMSLLVALPVRLGLEPVPAGRLIVIASAATTILLVVLIVGSAAGAAWGALAALAVAVTSSIVATHLMILSEPPFIALAMLTLALLVHAPDRPLPAGLVAGVAVLVRYAGLGLVGGVALWQLLQPGPISRRLRRAAIGAAPGIAAYGIWSAIVRRSGTAVRLLHPDQRPAASIRRFIGATEAWLAPGLFGESHRTMLVRVGIKGVVATAIVALLVSLGVSRARGRRVVPGADASVADDPSGDAGKVALAAAILAAGVGGLILVARLLESSVTLYDRMLSPVHALLDVALVAALAAWWTAERRADWSRALAVGTLVLWAGASASISAQVIYEARTVGLEHAAVDVRRSPLWTWVRDSGGGRPLYSNDFADVYLQTGRPSHFLPWIVTDDSVHALCAALARRPGLVVWVTAYVADELLYPELAPLAMTPTRLPRLVPLREVARFPDGVIWTPDSALSRDPRCVGHT